MAEFGRRRSSEHSRFRVRFAQRDTRPPTDDEAKRIRDRVDRMNAAHKGEVTADVVVKHGIRAWALEGVVFPAHDPNEKSS